MKKITGMHIVFSALWFVTGFVYAQPPSVPHILVYGTAVQEVEPDQVYWTLSLRSEGRRVAELANVHAERIKKTLAYLQNQKIKKEQIQTQQMNLSENWNYNTGKRVKEGYVASSRIQFRSDNLKQYADLWSGLAELEGISIESSYFDSSKRIALQDEARIQAIQVARQKAQAMVVAANMKIGKPLVIEEFQMGEDVRSPMMMESRAMMASDSGIVAPGQLEIRMQVKVIFSLE